MKFYQLTPSERRKILLEKGRLKKLEPEIPNLAELNHLSENVIGSLSLPVGIVENLVVNQKSFDVPMATEESSVVAAGNHAAKIFQASGGVTAKSLREGLYGQAVFLVDESFSKFDFDQQIPKLIERVNAQFQSLVNHGGGLKSITANVEQDVLELEILVDPSEAMGANKVNSILEYLRDLVIAFPGILTSQFVILSNYPSQTATAQVTIPVEQLPVGAAQKIAWMSEFGQENKLRAPTNNKGIMNGVDAVVLATGNDFRAVEVANQNLASKNHHYQSLSYWSIVDQNLIGQLTLSLPIGVVGGSINSRRDVQENLGIMGNPDVKALSEIIVAIGLANNFAALLAITTQGIQAGHMKLQLRNQLLAMNANEPEATAVINQAIAAKKYDQEFLQKLLNQIQSREN